jgi:hypothetical protein
MIVVSIILTITLAVYIWWSRKTINKIKRRLIRIDGDINSLHQNQSVLLSTLNQIYRELRTNERQTKKNSKVLKRQIHVAGTRPKSEGSNVI